MLEIILEKISLLIAPLIICTVVMHDARLEYVSEIANAPVGAFAEEIYKAESVILADDSVSQPSTKKAIPVNIVAQIENTREAATKPRKEDKEKDGAIEKGTSYDIYANS